MAAPPRELVSDVISEILLRLPPDEPECLFRAALVCKPWLRAISDAAFLSRYRAFHGTPPLLGLMDADRELDRGWSWSFRLVPPREVPAFPLPWPDAHRGRPLDCRHGRVLIDRCSYFLVCDPVTGKGNSHRLPDPGIKISQCSAQAVFCTASGCKHLDCYGGPFCVVLMGRDYSASTISATVYSSEIGAWSVPAVLQGICDEASGYGALVGDEIYFTLASMAAIAKYDWVKNCLSLISPPPSAVFNGEEFTLMVTQDSSLGLASIEHSNLYLWSRKVSVEGTAEWVQCRVIDLDTVMPMPNLSDEAAVVGFAEGVGVIFISTRIGLFMMELKSGKVRKVHDPHPLLSVLPYTGFYTPDRSRLLR